MSRRTTRQIHWYQLSREKSFNKLKGSKCSRSKQTYTKNNFHGSPRLDSSIAIYFTAIYCQSYNTTVISQTLNLTKETAPELSFHATETPQDISHSYSFSPKATERNTVSPTDVTLNSLQQNKIEQSWNRIETQPFLHFTRGLRQLGYRVFIELTLV